MHKLPKHWKMLPLAELVVLRKGKKPIKLLPVPFHQSVPYLDIDAIENNNYKQYADSTSTVISSYDDIFIVADGSRSGLVARGQVGAVGSTIICISPLTINSDFLLYFLQAQYEFFNKNTTGASIPHLNQNLLLTLKVPIPPPDEQVFIANSLKITLDKYQDDFKDAKNEMLQVQKYKRSVLDKAIGGDLTTTWRKQNKITLSETKDELLNICDSPSILNKRDTRFTVPHSWIITDAKSVCSKITDGEHNTPPRQQSGELLLSARNVRDGFIDYADVDYISVEQLRKLRKRCDPEKNDVLIVSVGATIGRTAIVSDNISFALVRSVLLLKPKISGYFLMYCLQSPLLQDLIKESCKGVAQAHLYITETNNLPIPFPSFAEQEQIVIQVDKHFRTAEQLEEKTKVTLKKVDDLQRSIFQLAYSGRIAVNPGAGKVDSVWFNEFVELNNVARQNFITNNKAISDKKKTAYKKLRDVMATKKSIIEILEGATKNQITVEDAWHQSHYYEKGEIEDFYEELESVSKKNKSGKIVSWEFTNSSKGGVLLKLK
ncbi:restriction endonuclease subunit S [Pedobacter polaris]|uniref:Restriction endonuclease subunit S n=1 Tax=Pedobacter polaris TaxID=2571273 RepID=A0A4U1CRJ7_9SPHI|nr:restriction endonuclease subunit S [Pedobacter polaris]TKC10691.1 restriction endonuclease subunit S [Pedobacter polaris]